MLQLFNRIKAWLRIPPLPPPVIARAARQTMPLADDAHAHLVSFDENLLERSRTQWQFGDWASLATLDRDTLQHHPDRAKLALLAAAGHQGLGNAADARQFTRLSIDWGCSKKLVTQILISGVHNTLGRAAAAVGNQSHALNHFESAIAIGSQGSDTRLLTQARISEQLCQLGLASGVGLLMVGSDKTTVISKLSPFTKKSAEECESVSSLNKQPDISIVVPVYNLEKILEKCLTSIQLQDNKNFEVIIVNDGSLDKTSEVAKRFSETDPRFKLIELECNKGVSFARNIGIGECSGEYIRFLDGDDELPPWSNKVLLINSINQDLVRGSYITFHLDQKEITDHSTTKIISDYHPYSLPYSAKSKLLYGMGSTIFSSKFIKDNKLRFSQNKSMAEDAQFMIDVYFSAKRCTLIPDVVHFYKKRMDSLSEKNIIDAEYMISVANKWMYLLSRAKSTSQADFAKKIFESNLNGYLKNIIFAKRDRLNAADLIEVDSVFSALIKEYEIGGNNEYSK